MVEQRLSFDRWAGDYDAFRPGYPEALFEDLRRVSPKAAPILEVGCGTGKATEGLVRLGRPVLAVEPGPAMIEQARRRIGDAPVRFVQSTFEDWAAEGGPFGLIACAQAWHWVNPAAGFAKSVALLAPGGVLAIFGNEEQPAPEAVRPSILEFHERIRRTGNVQYGGGLYAPGERISKLFDAAPEFSSPEYRVYRRTVSHTPDSYVALTATYSDVQAQSPNVREPALAALHEALSACCKTFEIPVETHLYWARPAR